MNFPHVSSKDHFGHGHSKENLGRTFKQNNGASEEQSAGT